MGSGPTYMTMHSARAAAASFARLTSSLQAGCLQLSGHAGGRSCPAMAIGPTQRAEAMAVVRVTVPVETWVHTHLDALHMTAAQVCSQEARCPSFVVERTQEQRRAQSFEQCLLRHGVDLESRYPDR